MSTWFSTSRIASNIRPARVVLGLALVAIPLSAQSTELSFEEKENFLRTAKVTRTRQLSEGITGSLRATLSDGNLTHEAHIQTVDIYKAVFTSALGTELNFKDSYKFNIAAYELARMLDLEMVPPSVERRTGGQTGAFTWWVDDVLMTEKQRFFSKEEPPDKERWNEQMYIVRVFDQLIYNTDRNLGNLVITNDWDLKMIDHTRAFRQFKKLKSEENLLRCDRKLLENLRALERGSLRKQLKPNLTNGEIDALLARRDRIVQLFEDRAKRLGEDDVYYDLLAADR